MGTIFLVILNEGLYENFPGASVEITHIGYVSHATSSSCYAKMSIYYIFKKIMINKISTEVLYRYCALGM